MFRTRFAVPAALAALLLSACMAVPTNLDTSLNRTTAQARYRAELTPPAQPITVGRLHSWEVRLTRPSGEPVTGASITIDGGMPQHGHGLPTQPRVTRELGDGRYLIEGMKFSMTGWWEIKLKIDSPQGHDDVTFNLVLPSKG